MTSSIKHFATVSLFALATFSASGAYAQTSSNENGASEDEIIVTAQRREEKLKDVPISVTALAGEQLQSAGLTGSREIATLTPGVMINTTGAAAQATIRGVGNTVVGGNSESPVSIYIDGVYVPGQYFAVFDLANIQSIQVLKGPQGTLFGRNATGGAILVTTSRPSDTFTGKFNASYARFNDVRLSGYVSGPIAENVNFDIAGNYHKDHGYARDVVRHTRLAEYKDYSVRAKIEIAPDSDTSVLLIGDYGKIRDETPVSFKPMRAVLAPVGAYVPANPFDQASTFDPFAISEGGGISLEVKRDFGGVTLKSLTAFRKTKAFSITDQDRVQAALSRIDQTIHDKYLTHEFTLSSSGRSPFQWIAGAFYYGDTVNNPTYSNVTTLLNNSHMQVDAWALFGEGTYALTDQLKVIAGVRYSNETRTALSRRLTGSPLVAFRELKNHAWTPRVSVVYAVTPDSNIYATFSKGFKSGLFPGTTFNGAPVQPEKITAYEAGYKLASGGTNFNVAGFYYDYKDLQVTTRTPSGLQNLLNAAKAKIYGIDADLSLKLSDALRLRFAGAYTHSEYTNFTNAPFFSEIPSGGNASSSGNATGNQLIRTPKWTLSSGFKYEVPVGSGRIDLSADAYYNSGFAWTVDNRYRQKAYTLVNAQMGWSPNDSLRLSVFGKNLTNELYAIGVSVTNAATAAAYARPRTYGVAASYKF